MMEDADDETKWITEEEAVDWVRRTYGMPWGPAMHLLRGVVSSGKIRMFDQVTDMSSGKPKHIPPRLSDLTGGFVHDQRINIEDLSFKVRQLLGEPPTLKPRGERPPKPKHKGPVPGTTDATAQNRRKLFTKIDRLMAEGVKSVTEAVRQLPGDLPGSGTPENNRSALVRLYKDERNR